MQLLSDVLTQDWVDGLDWVLQHLFKLPPEDWRTLLPGIHLTRVLGASNLQLVGITASSSSRRQSLTCSNRAISELTMGTNTSLTDSTNLLQCNTNLALHIFWCENEEIKFAVLAFLFFFLFFLSSCCSGSEKQTHCGDLWEEAETHESCKETM